MHRSTITTLAAAIVSTTFTCAVLSGKNLNQPLKETEILRVLERVSAWQQEHPNGTEIRDWVMAPLYDGLVRLSKTTGNPQHLAEVLRLGSAAAWTPGTESWQGKQRPIYFADNHAVGHAWLDIYFMDTSRVERLTPMKTAMDAVIARPVTEKLRFGDPAKTPGVFFAERWTWCDALYMAPPTLARLSAATDDQSYLDFLDQEYKVTVDDLFDAEENLFYRDVRFIGKASANGKKIFWSRGNGWVFAGLPLLLEILPESRSSRTFYIQLLQKMAPAIRAAQQPDGLWTPSLLDPQQIAIGETSGSAFFVFGLAWGVNNGFLSRDDYWPVVERGWNALLTRVSEDGRVGYVQRIGDSPANLNAESTQLYGTGGVLLAGCEILRGIQGNPKYNPEALLRAAEELARAQSDRARAQVDQQDSDAIAWGNANAAYRSDGDAPIGSYGSKRSIGGRPTASGFDHPIVPKGSFTFGSGATALLNRRQIIQGNRTEAAQILYTTPGIAQTQMHYVYSLPGSEPCRETRSYRLNEDKYSNEVTSRFSVGGKPAPGLEVAAGVTAPSPDGEFKIDEQHGAILWWNNKATDCVPRCLGVRVAPGSRIVVDKDDTGHPTHAYAVLRIDNEGEIRFHAGVVEFGEQATSAADCMARVLSSRADSVR
jgi:rhamnogalacturonyl hydrolase YesR